MWWIIGAIIYYFIGVYVICWLAGKTPNTENSAWVVIYAFGPFIWPIILCNYFLK